MIAVVEAAPIVRNVLANQRFCSAPIMYDSMPPRLSLDWLYAFHQSAHAS